MTRHTPRQIFFFWCSLLWRCVVLCDQMPHSRLRRGAQGFAGASSCADRWRPEERAQNEPRPQSGALPWWMLGVKKKKKMKCNQCRGAPQVAFSQGKSTKPASFQTKPRSHFPWCIQGVLQRCQRNLIIILKQDRSWESHSRFVAVDSGAPRDKLTNVGWPLCTDWGFWWASPV